MKTNRLFIKHFQFFARDFLHRGSPKPVTAAQASIALDYCNTEAKMYRSAQKTTRCQRSSQRLRYAKHSKCHRFLQQPFSNVVPESESSAVKRMRTQPASKREGMQLSRKVNEMPPSFLKLNSPFRTPFRTFFRFRIGCSSYAFGHFCNLKLKTHQIRPDFVLLHRFQALKDDTEQKTARFRHKKKNIFQSPI